MKRKFLSLITIVPFLISCGNNKNNPINIPVESITISETSRNIEIDSTFTLSYTINPSNATNQNVTWSVLDNSIVSCDEGLIKGLAVGSTTVSVISEDGHKAASCQVNVTSKTIHVESVSLNKSSITLIEGDKETLVPSISPANATNKNVRWVSNAPSVASISSIGQITAISKGNATITVTTVDGNKSATCSVIVNEKPKEFWPSKEIESFLSSKSINGVDVPSYLILEEEKLLGHEIIATGKYSYYQLEIDGNVASSYISTLVASNYSLKDSYYVDSSSKVAISAFCPSSTTIIKICAYEDVKPSEDTNKADYNLPLLIGNKEASQFEYISEDGIKFFLSKAGGTNNPKSSKDGGGYLAIYTNNTMTISNRYFSKIIFTFNTDRTASILVNEGTLTKQSATTFEWVGSSDELVVTAVSQSRLTSIVLFYTTDDHDEPSPTGVVTLKEVNDIAKKIKYTPNADGWYLSTTTVSVQVEAVDAIDSTVTSGGLSPNARGKILVVDATDYILCSSSTYNQGGTTLYDDVKNYLKKGTCQYEITGNIAFLNGVCEINVSSYKYVSTLVIEKNYESYVKDVFSTSTELVNDILDNTLTNSKGYGVHNVIKMNGLTYFNKYNSAGSYLFIDQLGNIVPVYSFLDKDKTSLDLNKCYDIVGYETLYLNRPSLRILKVSASSLSPIDFDFENNVTEVTDLSQFYSIKRGDGGVYNKSELTVYKADVYVSYYDEDKYTFNTTYSFINKKATTGNSQANAASNKSLGIFNENLTYKGIFDSYEINECSSSDEVEAKKFTLYFTLAFADTVNGLNMWRVNVFEDLVDSLEYYKASRQTVTFNTSESGVSCEYQTNEYQSWTYGEFVVKNESTDLGTVKRDPTYLKIVDCTSLTIEFTSEIIGFTFYHASYSYPVALEGISIRSSKVLSDHTEIVLKEPTKKVTINYFGVGGETYLKVNKIEIRYLD